MELTKEEKMILAKAKKIEAEALNEEASQQTTNKFEKTPGIPKDLGVAGQIILDSPRIANFTGRSLLDNNSPLVIDNTDDIAILKQKIAEFERILKGGE